MDKQELKVNQAVHSILYGGRDGYITKIVGKQTPENVKSLFGGAIVTGGSADIYIKFINGTTTNVPESIVRGVQWRIGDLLTNDEVAEYDRLHDEAKAENLRKAKEKELKDEQEKKEYLEKYCDYLIQPKDNPKGEFDTVKKNIRLELKKEFPNTKFSVRSNHYDSVIVEWTDGASEEEIKKITNKYEDHETDFTGDFRDYAPNNFNKIFGGCSYVFGQRNMSKKVEEKFHNWAKERFEENNVYNTHSYQNLAYRLFVKNSIWDSDNFEIVRNDVKCGLNDPNTFWDVISEKPISKEKKKRSIQNETESNNVQSKANIDNNGLTLVDYSEKSFIVSGNTFQHKDIFKDLNGTFRYNFKNYKNSGWNLSKKHLNKIKEIFGFKNFDVVVDY